MAIVTLGADVRIGPGSGMGQRRFDLVATSESTGAQQTRLFGPPRWTLTLVQPPTLTQADAGAWQALLMQLRGSVNHLAAWPTGREQPLGTMRGTPSLSGTHGAGATTAVMSTGQAGCTLLAGDWLQLGTGLGTSQLVMVTAACTADGSGLLSAPFEAPLRQAFAGGTAVTWWRPLGYYKLQSDGVAWSYGKGASVNGLAVDLMESWS